MKFQLERDTELYRVVEYILNRATARELEVIRSALERRAEDSHYQISGGNIREMAEGMNQAINAQFDTKNQVESMTRGFIRDLVHRALPDIPEEHLALLLEEWIPSQDVSASEEQLPPDAVKTMVAQFVDYSRGVMPQELQAQLRQQGDWSRRYWSAFSERTRDLIRSFLYGTIDDDAFWDQIDV